MSLEAVIGRPVGTESAAGSSLPLTASAAGAIAVDGSGLVAAALAAVGCTAIRSELALLLLSLSARGGTSSTIGSDVENAVLPRPALRVPVSLPTSRASLSVVVIGSGAVRKRRNSCVAFMCTKNRINEPAGSNTKLQSSA